MMAAPVTEGKKVAEAEPQNVENAPGVATRVAVQQYPPVCSLCHR